MKTYIMVEVFKTNVKHPDQASLLLVRIHAAYSGYAANFDLEDCDKILRVECCQGEVESTGLISIIRELGFEAEVLPDDIQQIHTF